MYCHDTPYFLVGLAGAILSLLLSELFHRETNRSTEDARDMSYVAVIDALKQRLDLKMVPSVLSRTIDLYDVSIDEFTDLATISSLRYNTEITVLALRVKTDEIDEFEEYASGIHGSNVTVVDISNEPLPQNHSYEYVWPILYEYFPHDFPTSLVGMNLHGGAILENFDEMVRTRSVVLSNPIMYIDTAGSGLLVLQPITMGGDDIVGCVVRGLRSSSLTETIGLERFLSEHDSKISMYINRTHSPMLFYDSHDGENVSLEGERCDPITLEDGTIIIICVSAFHSVERSISFILMLVSGFAVSMLLVSFMKIIQVVSNNKKTREVTSRLIADVSHEMRTPMNGIMGMSELLSIQDMSPECSEYVTVIRSCGNTLLSIINDLLDMSNVDSNKMDLTPVEMDIASIFCDALQSSWSSHTAESTDRIDVQLIMKIEDTVPKCVVMGDSSKIIQVVTNLVSNALKFTDTGKIEVTIRAKSRHQSRNITLGVDVTDTGIGICKSSLKKMFEPFTQVHKNRDTGGTGLGLAISRKLVGLMGGELSCKSILGEGTTFSFDVCVEMIGSIETISFHECRAFKFKRHGSFTEELSDLELGLEDKDVDKCIDIRTRTVSGDKSRCILVVDDNRVNRLVVSRLLNDMGFKTEYCCDGLEAVNACHSSVYSVIMMDMVMPEMDGVEATKAIRKDSLKNKETPIIFLSATVEATAIERCVKAGGTDFMTKPVSRVVLEEKLKRHMKT